MVVSPKHPKMIIFSRKTLGTTILGNPHMKPTWPPERFQVPTPLDVVDFSTYEMAKFRDHIFRKKKKRFHGLEQPWKIHSHHF